MAYSPLKEKIINSFSLSRVYAVYLVVNNLWWLFPLSNVVVTRAQRRILAAAPSLYYRSIAAEARADTLAPNVQTSLI